MSFDATAYPLYSDDCRYNFILFKPMLSLNFRQRSIRCFAALCTAADRACSSILIVRFQSYKHLLVSGKPDIEHVS